MLRAVLPAFLPMIRLVPLGSVSPYSPWPRCVLVLLLLTAALLTSVWFELGRAGYLGRVLGYPSALFIFGLLATSRKLSLWSVVTLALFALSTATRHAGVATALVLCAIGGPYILVQ